MFGNTHYHNHTEVSVCHPIVKQAPTHESVKLLQEMQNAAAKALVRHGTLENTELKIRWHLFIDWPTTGGYYTLYCQFKINGVEHTIKKELNARFRGDPTEIFEAVRTVVTEAVQEHFLKSFYESRDFKDTIYSYSNRNQSYFQ